MWKAAEKVKGLFGKRKINKEILADQADAGRRLLTLSEHPCYLELQKVIGFFENQTTAGFKKRNVGQKNLERLNHRAEMLEDIQKEIKRRIETGQRAELELKRLLEEEQNARRKQEPKSRTG